MKRGIWTYSQAIEKEIGIANCKLNTTTWWPLSEAKEIRLWRQLLLLEFNLTSNFEPLIQSCDLPLLTKGISKTISNSTSFLFFFFIFRFIIILGANSVGRYFPIVQTEFNIYTDS